MIKHKPVVTNVTSSRRFSRPATAHPALPVHVERVTTTHFSDNTRRDEAEWLGSYPTPEIAEGKTNPVLNRQPDAST